MINIGKSIEAEEVEIKLIPLDSYNFLLQIHSGVITGTLVLDKTIDKDELLEFSEAVYELLQQYDLHNFNDDEELPQ